MQAYLRVRTPVKPEQIKGARIVAPAPGATKWGWPIDVASNWSVPVIIVKWPAATEQILRSIRPMLNASRSTGEFRRAARIRGYSIVIARFGLKRSLLLANDSERSESHAKFAVVEGAGVAEPDGSASAGNVPARLRRSIQTICEGSIAR